MINFCGKLQIEKELAAITDDLIFTFTEVILRRLIHIIHRTVFFAILLFAGLWLALQFQPVQQFAIDKTTQYFKKEWKVNVSIKHVDFSFFDDFILEGVYVEDQKKDTLLYAGRARVQLNDWFFLQDTIIIKQVGLSYLKAKTNRTDSVWNYQFIADYFSGGDTTKAAKEPILVALKRIELHQIHIEQVDKWIGQDLIIDLLDGELDAANLGTMKDDLVINQLYLNTPYFRLNQYDGKRPPKLKKKFVAPLIKPGVLRWNKDNKKILVKNIRINNGRYYADLDPTTKPLPYFDGLHMDWFAINADIKNLRLQADSLKADIKLAVKERSGLQVKQLAAQFKWWPQAMEFNQLMLVTPRSRLSNYYAMRYKFFVEDFSKFITNVTLAGKFTNSVIHTDDIAFFAPELQSWKKSISANGTVFGTIANFKATNLTAQTGKTKFRGDVYVKGLPDINTTVFNIEGDYLETNIDDIGVVVPALREQKTLNLNSLGNVNGKGSFIGTIYQFKTVGNLQSAIGAIEADLSFKLPIKGIPSYSGQVITSNFNVGELIQQKDVGTISAKTKINGDGFNWPKLKLNIESTVDKATYQQYTYHHIALNGQIKNGNYEGFINSKDRNADFSLAGTFQLNNKRPYLNASGIINHIDFKQLGFSKDTLEFSGDFNVKFNGNNLDNFLGEARIDNANLHFNKKRLSFDSLVVKSDVISGYKTLEVKSNNIDALLMGEFKILELQDAFNLFLSQYYPSYFKALNKKIANQSFSFVINTGNVSDYVQSFAPSFSGFNDANIAGYINTSRNQLQLNVRIPSFQVNDLEFSNLFINGNGNLDSLNVETQLADLRINDTLNFPDSYIKLKATKDSTFININADANQTINDASLNALAITYTDGFKVLFDTSAFILNGKRWLINQNSELVLRKSEVSSDGLVLTQGSQQITIATQPSAIGSTNDLVVNLRNIIIEDWTPYLKMPYRMEGILDGDIMVEDPLGKQNAQTIIQLNKFRFDNDSIGSIVTKGFYNKKNKKFDFSMDSKNPNNLFNAKGAYVLGDTTNAGLDLNIQLDGMALNPVEAFLTGIFDEVNGQAFGELKLFGKPDALKLIGDVEIKDANMLVSFTKCRYNIPSAKFSFSEDRIDFGNIILYDKYKETGLARGVLYHESFNKMRFDFDVEAKRFELLNTTARDNDVIYGKARGKAALSLKGPMEDMLLKIAGAPTDSSKIYMPNSDSKTTSSADFIVYKTYGTEMNGVDLNTASTKLTMDIEVTTNPLASIDIILDELTGDVISGRGNGTLRIKLGTEEPLSINGRVEILSGNYKFSTQSVITKPFILKENANNFIDWSGDPFNANIKIEALYEAKDVSLSSLTGQNNESAQVNPAVSGYRGSVYVDAKLTEDLFKPKIDFGISFPKESPAATDPSTTLLLQRIENDVNELNKQVMYLIVFGSFAPYGTSQNNALFSNIGTTAFTSISGSILGSLDNELNRTLNKIFKDPNFKVNVKTSLYNGSNFDNNSSAGNQFIDFNNLRSSVNVKGQYILNDRLSFSFGSNFDFGLGATQQSQLNFQFLPDLTAEWKITPDGRVFATFFHRNTRSTAVNSGRPNQSSGASISYRKEVDRIDEIFRKKKKQKL